MKNIDQIFNLACPASPIYYQKDPISTLKTCFHGTENILDLAAEKNARILHTSTSEVYGDPQVHPQPESYWGYVNPFGARSCYDEGKRVAEALCYAYQAKYQGMEIRIARIFNTYGPRMSYSDGRVVSSFIGDALAGKEIKITGDGTATRSFQYITDCVEGLYRLMNSDYALPVNIGNPGEFTIREFADIVVDMIAEIGKPRVPIIYLPRPSDDPNTRQPDITRAKEVLDWEPTVALKEGLKNTVEWHLKQSI
ncbi:UDP-glucuronic acid decarboxylase 1 [Penicillium argentinense]|uniref:UDP-glucuronic acid decarboxylase 1 n=1 Tax=Penicillium argentinense TaxID=1131581 RepID=A0A9W9KEU6_9EURO|nr:UDP-glucuronic acid decarboxylase 1 [Penicillium argentinense]KAJ5102452.1 UDP-glucuronic acid decarboxylase 1 [Penicillium argentinense]